MEVTNEKVIGHLRDLFALWRAGEINTKQSIRLAEYVVGGYLVLNSGLEGFAAGSSSLQESCEQSEELQVSLREFALNDKGLAGPKAGWLQVVIKKLMELLMANLLVGPK